MKRIYKYGSPEQLFDCVLSGMILQDIAKKYNVSYQAIQRELRKNNEYHEFRRLKKEKKIIVIEDYETKWIRTFWDKVQKSDGCWLWKGNTASRLGYGVKRYHGRGIYAHRKMWEIYNGNIPDGMFICHHCDNPPCCNPDHLFLGTPADNMHDRDTKGRGNSGKRIYNINSEGAKRSEYRKERAKILKDLGKSNKEISDELKCHPHYVYCLLHPKKAV